MLGRLVRPPNMLGRQIHGPARIVLARARELGHSERREERDLVRRQRFASPHKSDERQEHVPKRHVVLLTHGYEQHVVLPQVQVRRRRQR